MRDEREALREIRAKNYGRVWDRVPIVVPQAFEESGLCGVLLSDMVALAIEGEARVFCAKLPIRHGGTQWLWVAIKVKAPLAIRWGPVGKGYPLRGVFSLEPKEDEHAVKGGVEAAFHGE